MENNFENTPDRMNNTGGDDQNTQNTPNWSYTDPNAGYQYNSGYSYYQGDNGSQNMNSNYNNYNMDQSPMTLGDWVLTILAWMIPCVGLVLYLVWAFGKNGNINRRNFCRAWLIIYAVVLVLSIILVVVLGVSMASIVSEYGMYY